LNWLLEKVDTLDPRQRWLLFGLILILFVGLGYYLHAANAETLETLSAEVGTLQESLQRQRTTAARLEDLRPRLAALDAAVKLAVTLLPETREIPELLTQISELGLKAGLEFRLFKPEAEKHADFYAEVPVSLIILGKFHDVARFFDHLSRLSRIVNVTDIKIALNKGSEAELLLSTTCLVTTFRFLEPQETDGKKGGRSDGQRKGS
jgi:type IV pilus assembly protein PilO